MHLKLNLIGTKENNNLLKIKPVQRGFCMGFIFKYIIVMKKINKYLTTELFTIDKDRLDGYNYFIALTKDDNKIHLKKEKQQEEYKFTIKISKSVSDPSKMITVEGSDPEVLLSQFKRCLCKKVSNNNVKICYLHDHNSNRYHEGTPANTNGTEGDVMVYFPEMWYLGTDTDNEWVMNISTVEQEGWKHAPASLVGAYKAKLQGIKLDKMHSISGADSDGNISMADFSLYARNRGAGYHLIDYQQHCIIAWMFYARYKNTNSQTICGTGKNTDAGVNCGVTNNLGMNDTTAKTASGTSDMLVNFLGLEGCWGYKYEWIEGIHTHDTDGVIAYDKGDYHDQPFSSVQSSTKRILRTSSEGNLYDYISKIKGGEYMDMLPSEVSGAANTHFSDFCNMKLGSMLVFGRSNNYANFNCGVTSLNGGYSSSNRYLYFSSRLAFDGNIEVVDDVNTFKSLPLNN